MSTITSFPPTSIDRLPGPRPWFPGHLAIAVRADILGFLTRMARRYGDVVQFPAGGYRLLLMSHPDAVRDVLVTRENSFIKGPALQRAKQTLGEGLLTSEGELHRRQRRLAQPAFHPNRVAGYGSVMAGIAERVVQQWSDGQHLDLHHQMMRITLLIVAKTLFDADVESDVAAIGEAVDTSVRMFTRVMAPWGALLNRLPLKSNHRFHHARKHLFETIDRFVQEHRASGADRGDLLSILLRAHDAEQLANPDGDDADRDIRLRQELYIIFTAGHETTANALTFSLYLMAQHPEAEAKVMAELNDVLSGRLPTVADVDRLAYLRMVLAEAMRLYPPAWAVGRQAIEEVEIAGHLLPKDSVVLNCQWITHRDPRWFPDPLRFDPQRWTVEAKAARPRWSYYPFGGGSRQCIGESFAWMEATLILATILQRWRLQLLDHYPLKLLPTITLRPKHGVPVVVKRR